MSWHYTEIIKPCFGVLHTINHIMLLRIDDLDKRQARGIQKKDTASMFKIGRSGGVVDLSRDVKFLNMYFPFNLSV